MESYDAIIVGGGIQGAAMAYEAARRGLRSIILDQSAIGTGASANSFGIVHGGLRYLQSLDLARWQTSRREQQWFLVNFPGLVRPVECMMPLYRGRLRSPMLFRTAFALHRALGGDSIGRVVGRAPTSLPIPQEGLIGAAIWTEASFDEPARLIGALLSLAGDVTVREHASIGALAIHDGLVAGIEASGSMISAPRLFLCGGAANRTLAARLDRDRPELSARVLAFNLLFDVAFDEPGIMAVTPEPGRGRSYFLRSHRGRLLAGTYYLEATHGRDVPRDAVSAFVADLAQAVPSMALDRTAIAEIWAGLLPDRGEPGPTLRAHDLLVDHGADGGPRGLFTLHPTKLTTSRHLAARAAAAAWPDRRPSVVPSRAVEAIRVAA